MAAAGQTVSRGPTTATLRSIEKVLRDSAVPMSRYRIRHRLARQIAAPLLDEALDYLAEHGMVRDEGPGGTVAWIWTERGQARGSKPRSVRPALAGSKGGSQNTSREFRVLLRERRNEILAIAAKHGAVKLRVFGSVARGEADAKSDLDLLVSFEPSRSLLDQIALQQDLEELLGVRVDVVSEGGISPYIRDRVLKEAVPL